MASLSFVVTGDVNIEVTITELSSGALQFDLSVLDNTGLIGDLRGFFFDLSDDSLTNGLSVSGADITDDAYKVDGVTKTSGSNNVNGDVIHEYGKFDVGFEIGTQGISSDDIQSTTFVLSHDTVDLSLSDLELQDIAIRLMSVGEPDGSREGSLKLGADVPEYEPSYIAIADTMTVYESETAGDVDLLDSGDASVLANDETDGGAYTGAVEGVNGAAQNVGIQVTGTNGGLLTIGADGSVDFDANDDFDFLGTGESAQTTFTYEIAGGETASVTVNVMGEDDVSPPDQTINIAIMLNSALTMYATAQATSFGVPEYPDINGDGQPNQLMDMAYLMLNDFIADAFDDAAAAGATLNISLISFGAEITGEGSSHWSVDTAASFASQLDAKVSADNSADYGQGFYNANAWLDTVATATSTNAVFVIGDGFSSGSWTAEHAPLLAEHDAQIDAYFPDLDFGGSAGVSALNQMDKDGFAEMVFTDDPALAAIAGQKSVYDVLSLSDLLV